MTVVRELVAKFGLDFDSAKFENANGVITFLKENLQAVATVAVGSAAVGIAYLAREAGQAARELTLTAEAFGQSANELLAWRTVAEGAGVEAEQFRTVLAAFARQATAAGENPALRRVFEELGVSLRGANDEMRPSGELLRDTLVGLNGIQDPSRRAALAMQLLGEQGARLLPAFANGSASLEEMQAAVEGLFGEDIEAAAEQSRKLDAELADLNLSWQSMKTSIALEVLPHLQSFVRGIGDFFRPLAEAARGTNILKLAFGALGIAAIILGIKMILPFLPAILIFALIAAGVLALIVIVDDLIAMFSGGKSVIAEFIDELFGAGTAADLVHDLKAGWEETIRFWDEDGIPALRRAWADIKRGVRETIDFWAEAWDSGVSKIQGLNNAIALFFRVTLPIAWARAKVGASGFFQEVGIQLQALIGRAGAAARAVAAIGRGDIVGAALAAREGLAQGAIADVRTAVVRTTGAAQVANTIRQVTNVGGITVNGAGDPEETARRVEERLNERQTRDLATARDSLVRTAD